MHRGAIHRVLYVIAAAVALAGCRQVAPKITGVRIVVTSSQAFDQITFGLDDGASNHLIPPQTRPSVGGARLTGQQDFVVYLDDGKDGIGVVCTAKAWLNQQAVASGTSAPTAIRLHRQQIVRCDVDLAATSLGDGGPPDSGAPDAPGPMPDAADTGSSDASDAVVPPADAHDAPMESPPDAGRDGLLGDILPDTLPGLLPDIVPDLGLPP